MELNKYQELAHRTGAKDVDEGLLYAVPAIAEEVGEVSKLFAKEVRDGSGQYRNVDKQKLLKELGDVVWMVAEIATLTGLSLDDICTVNNRKLQDRLNRDKIHGSGDER